MIPFSERIPIKDAKTKDSEKVVIAGYVHEIRALGKMSFISLRDWTGRIQVLAKKNEVGDEIFAKVNLNKEDVIIIEGTVKKNTVAPDGVEIILSNIDVLSKVENKLPVDPTGITPTDIDVRLDYRFIDLRSPNVNTIFRAKSIMANAFREYALKNGFVEIHPTSLAGAATEGGTDIFEVEYFEKKVYLVQSPQFYKQMAVIGGLEKVFMTTPVFRAEKHNTIHHLNEIIQMDCEIGFADDKIGIEYLKGAFKNVINRAYEFDKAKELNPELNEIKEIKTYTYTEIIDLLNENNMKIKWGDDFSREHEKKIYEILNEESYVISEYPTAIRAFYSMPKEGNPEISKSYDLMYKGLEVSSGAQRIHIASLIEEQLRKRNLDPISFKFYIDSFRYGAPPHAGWSLGLERLTMKALNLNNIRESMMFPRDRTRIAP
jgi:aspartyl-tRNA synthetase